MMRPPNTRLEGSVAVVTGAAHGIGRAICVELAREGARVWACDILAADLEETRRAVDDQTAARAHTAVVDVTDPAQVNAFVARIADAEDRIDILVNTVAPGFVRSNPTTEKQWEAMGAEAQRHFVESIALRRLGKAEEIARAVVFFASADASYVTGQTISVDGGKWMLG